METKQPLIIRTLKRISPSFRAYLASVSSRVSDLDTGWAAMSGSPLDQSWADLSGLQDDALESWRKNPLTRRIVSLAADYIVGDGITVSSTYAPLQRFIDEWWYHPQNKMDLRLEPMRDGLTLFGELFPVLNIAADGMSYIRFKPARYIDQIKWREGDYESETEYHETADLSGVMEGRWWPSPLHPNAENADQIMLHYAVNRQIGCTRGESDLGPALIWLKRYSHWLEDRVRLNWASRMFLWLVQVPTAKVEAKRRQYKEAPQPGSIIVHDDGETWDMKAPGIHAGDAEADGRAIKRMAAVASGQPLHRLSDEENANLATAQAMEEPANRHYTRRQKFFSYILADLVATAFNYYTQRGQRRWQPVTYQDVIVTTQDIERDDNTKLAIAAKNIVQMLAQLRDQLILAQIEPTDALNRKTVELAFKFAGEILSAEEVTAMLTQEPQV